MSFIKIQIISPLEIGCPEPGNIYFGKDEIGLWEKYPDCTWNYITTGLTTGGNSGTSGTSGLNGVDGSFLGTHGTSGTSGKTGTSGTSGKTGSSGITGTSGTSGNGTSGSSGSGTSGSSGSSGKTGTTGSSGSSGSSGRDGTFFGSSGISGGYGGATRRWYGTNTDMPTNQQVSIVSSWYIGNHNFSIVDTIRIHRIDADLQDLTFWVSFWSDGILKIEDRLDLSLFGLYRVRDISTPILPIAGYVYEIPLIALGASNSDMIQDREYLVSFLPAISGITGESGTSGTSGDVGTSGSSGKSGSSGSSGTSGTSGSSGISGKDFPFYIMVSGSTYLTTQHAVNSGNTIVFNQLSGIYISTGITSEGFYELNLSASQGLDEWVVINVAELNSAWAQSVASSRLGRIYCVGHNFVWGANTDYLILTGAHQIEIVGLPNATFNVGTYTIRFSYGNLTNISWVTAGTNYITSYNGYLNLTNNVFASDNKSGLTDKIHIYINGASVNGTGLIDIDGIRHYTQTLSWNNGEIIQPIRIHNASNSYDNLYVYMKRVAIVSSFERFSRVRVSASILTDYKVSGDETWYYAPEQEMPGVGYIESTSEILKISSVDKIRAQFMPIGSTGITNHVVLDTSDNYLKVITLSGVTSSFYVANTPGGSSTTQLNFINGILISSV